MKFMRKYIGFFLAVLFGFFITILLFNTFKTQNEESERTNIQSDSQYNFYRAQFNPQTAVTGPDFRVAAQMSVDAVVHIRSEFMRKTNRYDDFFGSLRDLLEGRGGHMEPRYSPYLGYGSGVVIAKDGYIVTNNHVVEGASKIEVILNDKRSYQAELIGADPSTDLALIKIEEDELPYLIYGDSDELQIGEWVLAVGNPFNLTSTVTAGIVSAKARNINILGTNSPIESFIQTDAAVNVGNSGGALVNKDGYLVGINAAIASSTGAYEGYAFAIPVNIVKKVMDDLLKYGEVKRAYIGVSITDISAEFAKEIGAEPKGVYVASVTETGGAALAGIKNGDIIISIDNVKVNSTSRLLEIIGQHRPGDSVSIVVLRKGSQKTFVVILQNEQGTTSIIKEQKEFYLKNLGATFINVPEKDKNKLDLKNGLKVVDLSDDGLLKNGGVREGFIILRINNSIINSKQDIEYAISNARDGFLKVEGIYTDGMRVIYGFEM